MQGDVQVEKLIMQFLGDMTNNLHSSEDIIVNVGFGEGVDLSEGEKS